MKVKLLTTFENIVAKGEIARFEQFLLLSECFQKSSASESSESVYKSERYTSAFQRGSGVPVAQSD